MGTTAGTRVLCTQYLLRVATMVPPSSNTTRIRKEGSFGRNSGVTCGVGTVGDSVPGKVGVRFRDRAGTGSGDGSKRGEDDATMDTTVT